MNLRDVKIDKTAHIEAMLAEHLVICLNGMPGVGKKTAIRVLLEKHPEVNAVFCSVDEIRDATAFEKADEEKVNWYLIRKPEGCVYPESNEGLWRFIYRMRRQDRIFLATDGIIPESLLELTWNGVMGVVIPETFWFTEVETYRYLKKCKSSLRYRDVYYLTGGWPGCIAMLVRLEKQLRERWSAWELCGRYEIRKYIQKEILSVLPEEELQLLKEWALFPYLNPELVALLWENSKQDIEEQLFARGAMTYVSEKVRWYVQPALRMAVEPDVSAELCQKAAAWYEEKGDIQAALLCCWYFRDNGLYRDCLIRNYDKVPFLGYEKIEKTEANRKIPELFYLEWMEYALRLDTVHMSEMRLQAEKLAARAETGGSPDREKVKEILLNIAYTDPKISTIEWMELLRKYTEPGQPVRLYCMLGESVSHLSGLRDLSELFACGKKERREYKELWEERLSPSNWLSYRIAELEYELQTDGVSVRNKHSLEMLPEVDESAPWQARLGLMYLAYLSIDYNGSGYQMKKYIMYLAESLAKETMYVCRWNARALLYLAKVKWGEREDLIKWVRETDGDIENKYGKTKFYMAAEVKVCLYLGNYARAEEVLSILIPFFKTKNNWRWIAESLFQRALIEWEKGETNQALKSVAESMAVANPYRYVKVYTGYGKKGADLLEQYRNWLKKTDPPARQRKKKYKYGNVQRMPAEDWLDYIVRRAVRQKKHFSEPEEKQESICRVEKLTVTEHMVLLYLARGFSNTQISEAMNIKLPTVKSHIYNIYRKLGVTTRIQAVRKAAENGIL